MVDLQGHHHSCQVWAQIKTAVMELIIPKTLLGYEEVHIRRFPKLQTSHSTQCCQYCQMALYTHNPIISHKMSCKYMWSAHIIKIVLMIVVLHLKYNLASKSYSCYSSLTIPSGRPPWLENIKTTERLIRDTYKRNEVLQNAMLDEFIKDTLHAEIVGIVSSTLTVCNFFKSNFLGY